MTKRMLIDALHREEMRVVLTNNRQIEDFDFVTAAKKQVKGNIYLAKITRVEPSLQAAFVEYGGGKQGFLPFSEIHPDYYQIPVSDRKRLIEEAEAEAAAEEAAEAAEHGEELEHALPPEASEGEEPLPETPEAMPFEIPAMLEEVSSAPVESAAQEDWHPEDAPRSTMAESSFDFSSSAPVADALPEDAPASEASAEGEAGGNTKVEEVKTSEEFETISGEAEAAPKRRSYLRRYKIQEVIKRGQVVLVQVIKEERGNKGVSLTTFLSLPGRYCVLMPNSPKDGGISRKIANNDDRKRLKQICAELKLARGMSVIIRTAGMDRTRAEIKRDFDYLVKLWNQIRDNTLSSTAPALIYEESDLVKRCIRDLYTSDIEEIVVQGDEAFETAREFMKMILPSHTSRIRHYTDSTPLFYAYDIEENLLSMLDPVVKLRSGGYIVINPTEALVSIDVNSGRSTGERNIEETATKTNIEAAQEIARQLRLRDLAGLVVIDFIDMFESRNRRAVEKSLKDALKTDRAKIQLGRISPFGLLEMSRQRLRPSLSETSTMPCPHCSGRGHVRSDESLSIQIIRMLEKEASTGNWHTLRLSVPENIALHMLNTKRSALDKIETLYGVSLQILVNHQLGLSAYHIEKMRRSTSERPEGERSERPDRGDRNNRRDRDRGRRGRGRDRDQSQDVQEPVEQIAEQADIQEIGEGEQAPEGDRQGRDRDRRGGRRRGRRGGRNRGPRDNNTPGNEEYAAHQPQGDDADGNSEAPQEQQTEGQPAEGEQRQGRRERGRRGGRGRRRWQERDGNTNENGEQAQANTSRNDNVEDITSWRSPPLPAFATEAIPVPNRSEPVPQAAAATRSQSKAEDTPPPGTPRKGWWQKMIELDD